MTSSPSMSLFDRLDHFGLFHCGVLALLFVLGGAVAILGFQRHRRVASIRALACLAFVSFSYGLFVGAWSMFQYFALLAPGRGVDPSILANRISDALLGLGLFSPVAVLFTAVAALFSIVDVFAASKPPPIS